MFCNFGTAHYIAIHCMDIDLKCWEELRSGQIVSERDYVSALSSRIRDRIGLNFSCYAQTLKQGLEVENGVDGIIIFKVKDEVKVGWYEAKWPRVLQTDYHWDRVPRGHDRSHFSDQILRQHKWSGEIALWEMFFNEGVDGTECPPFQSYGSSCAWHENAFDFIVSKGILFDRWTTEKLRNLLEGNCLSFYSIIYDMLCCRKGKKFKIQPGQKSLRLEIPNNKTERKDFIEIPLPENINKEYDTEINTFMKQRNIAGYIYLDLNEKLNM